MNGREQGLLLLTAYLGDPGRKPLTVAQLRTLQRRAQLVQVDDPMRDIEAADLMAIGYHVTEATRIVQLLSQEQQLKWYVQKGKAAGCVPITRASEHYPQALKQRLGWDAPGSLWARGDIALLEKPSVALIGNRELGLLNEAFAQEVGEQAARQGYVLVSGNASGADRVAQESCLRHGGQVISVVADQLSSQKEQDNVLYLSEDGFDLRFSAQRALSRNRVIHALPRMTFVAQCNETKGGTWDGTVKNLKNQWSPVFCLDDNTEGIQGLLNMGAEWIQGSDLLDLSLLLKNIGL